MGGGEVIRIRLLLAKFPDDTEPVVVAAIDETIWNHWDEADDADWVNEGQRRFGGDPTDFEWRQAWAAFAPSDLVAVFHVPTVHAFVTENSPDA